METPTGTRAGPPPSTTKSTSLQRIQRLERLERERLEAEARREERRRGTISEQKPTGGRHDLVDRIERVTKFPLAALGVAWLVLVIIVVTTDQTGTASVAVVATLFVLWTAVLVEYAVRLVVTPDRRGYLKRRWVEPATVLLPPLQGWHIVGIEKVCLIIYEGALRVEVVLRHHSLFRVLLAAVGTLFIGAWLVFLFEENAKGGNIHSYPDALWWAIVTVTTVGYGDRFPVSPGGRAVAVVLMLVGIGLLGVLTATIASVFMKEHTDDNRDAIQKGHADLGTQLEVINRRLGDLELRLGATPQEVAAAEVTTTSPQAPNGPEREGAGGGSTS